MVGSIEHILIKLCFLQQPSQTVPLKIVAKCRPLLESEKGTGKRINVSGQNITLEHGGQV